MTQPWYHDAATMTGDQPNNNNVDQSALLTKPIKMSPSQALQSLAYHEKALADLKCQMAPSNKENKAFCAKYVKQRKHDPPPVQQQQSSQQSPSTVSDGSSRQQVRYYDPVEICPLNISFAGAVRFLSKGRVLSRARDAARRDKADKGVAECQRQR